MADNRDELLRARAYALWEEEGRPHGRDADHWAAAEAELFGDAAKPAAAPEATAKPARKPRAPAAPRRKKGAAEA